MFDKKKIPVQKCVYTTPVEARPDQKNLMMWVRVEDLPRDLGLDPNARRADVSSKVAQEIQRTLREAPESFWKLNTGIQMTARDVEIKDGRMVTLDLFDPEDDNEVADGVINGGHTYESIKKVLKEAEAEAERSSDADERERLRERVRMINNAIVRVEVLTGIERKELADISRARNTGEAVKKYSLQNLKKLYDPIKKELGPEVCTNIGFCENDVDLVPGKTYQVLDLIRMMSLFNNELYPFGKDRHPVACYASAGRLVDKWESDAKTYEPLVPRLQDFMALHDQVYLLVCDWQDQQKGRPRNGFEKKDTALPFTGKIAPWKVSTAFIYPLIAALRILLDPKTGGWKMSPTKFVKSEGAGMIAVLMAFYDEQCKGKPHETGRSVGSWRAVVAEARARYAEWMLSQEQASARA
jgi:AIPR protein